MSKKLCAKSMLSKYIEEKNLNCYWNRTHVHLTSTRNPIFMLIPHTKQHICFFFSYYLIYVDQSVLQIYQILVHTLSTYTNTPHYHTQQQQHHQFQSQGILNHLKETVEKNWNEKKDEFGGRQKGKHFVLRVFQLYKLPNHSV